MPCRGSPDGAVKADSPVRGWSEAESLDRTEASPTLCHVMADSGAGDARVGEHAGARCDHFVRSRVDQSRVSADPILRLVACARVQERVSMPLLRHGPAAAN